MKNKIAEKYIEEKGKQSAFPFQTPTGYYEVGMSLKEYYAGVALNAIIQAHFNNEGKTFRNEWIDLCRHAEAFGRLMVRAIAEDQAKQLQESYDVLNKSDVSDSEDETGGWK